MQESDHRSPLLEKVLRPGDTDVRNQLEINRLCDMIRQTSFDIREHIAQLLGYLRASRIEHGLLINFGGPKLQIKKYILSSDAQL